MIKFVILTFTVSFEEDSLLLLKHYNQSNQKTFTLVQHLCILCI